MNKDIAFYIEQYKKTGMTMTANVEIKNMIVSFLNSENEKFSCKMDDYFQFTISKC